LEIPPADRVRRFDAVWTAALSRHIPAVREALGPAQRQHEGHGGELAHTGNAGQPFHFRMSSG